MSDERWYFTKEQLENSPSRRCGIDAEKELMHRQQAANFIRDVGKRLSLTQLCISTAIVYMHRFYMFHSFTHFHRNTIAMAALFLAAKVEEQPRKLEYIIKMAQWCLQKGQTNTDCNSESYLEQAQELVMNENILLQTLGFDMAVEHPHTYIVQFCELASLSKDISHASYFWASNSLYLTTMCLQYRPTVVACFCIHLVCRWSNCEIPKSKENLSWWSYIDESVTQELLEQMTNEFLVIYDKCPSRLKKIIQNSQKSLSSQNSSLGSLSFDGDRKPNANGAGHSMASTSSTHHPKMQLTPQQLLQQQPQPSSSSSSMDAKIDAKFIPGPSRAQKSSASLSSSNHHQSFHSPAAKPGVATSSSSVNGSNSNTMSSSQPNRSNSSSTHVSSSQQRQQLQQQQQQQQQMSSSSQHTPHTKVLSSGAIYNATKSKINPAAGTGHSTGPAANTVAPSTKDTIRPDQRKMTDIKQEPASVSVKHESIFQPIKQEPGYNATAAAVASISNYTHPTSSSVSAAVKNPHNKKENSLHQDGSRITTNSHSDIISNVIKEVAMAKQIEKQRTVVKNEPSLEKDSAANASVTSSSIDAIDSVINSVVGSAKSSKNHSIFSPSPVGHDSIAPSPIEERTIPAEVHIKQEPATTTTPSKSTSRQYRPGIPDSELIPVMQKVETVAGFEDIFKKNTVVVPSSSSSGANVHQPVSNHKKNNGVSAAIPSSLSNVSVKEEPCEVKTEPGEHSKSTTAISQLLLSNHNEEQTAARGDRIDVAASASDECSTSHTHKKKKKHKEKDKRHDKEKRHKEKKRHKEDKHRHCKEHSKEKELKEPGPIKITIPKEKLVDIPMKLKIKINKDQIIPPSSTAEEGTSNDFKLKISKDMLKSRKRERESDHDHSSKKFAHNNANNSHNGYKDYL
ncbi:cyclin-T1-like [Planococcus citri]|uniref:cyclin-T1-like n=1 Tax=Planococcus citri TaxID=170843 RepID=UPI0031F96A61